MTASHSRASPAPLVSLQRVPDYSREAVSFGIDALLAPLGGLQAFVRPADRVLLKPNLVLGFPPDRAVNTHPMIVREVARLALDLGAEVTIGDSPGFGTMECAARKAGLTEAMQGLQVKWTEFTRSSVSAQHQPYRHLLLAREVLEADVVVNLPKLKTHCQMGMTLSVKNMFGSVVGLEKFQSHYRAGTDKMAFARMLYDIANATSPALTIMDAVLAMDGDGPTGGRPVQTGFLAAGMDMSAVDAVMLDILGLSSADLLTLQAASDAGDTGWESVRTVGPPLHELRPAQWNLPRSLSLALGGPRWLLDLPLVNRWLRRQIIPWPSVLPSCVGCGNCAEVCPAHAISLVNRRPQINESTCIRCYCCHELCQYHAMSIRRGWIGRLARRLLK